MIGSKGLVAVFAGDVITPNSINSVIGGGFVARPSDDVIQTTDTLTTADWLRGFDFEDRLRLSAFENPAHFLRGDRNGLVTDGFDSLVDTDESVFTVTQRFLRLDEDRNSGVSFFAGTKDTITRHYAGLLSSTDVGLPLDSSAATATWESKIGVILGEAYSEDDFELMVDFNTRTISASGIEIGGKTNVGLTGNWSPRSIPTTGDPLLAHTSNASGRFAGTITGLDDTVDGMLTGLIGQGGAVGAFISGAGSATTYAGGFAATPPAAIVDKVSYTDWAGQDDWRVPTNNVSRGPDETVTANQFFGFGITDDVIAGFYRNADVTSNTLATPGRVGRSRSSRNTVVFFGGYFDEDRDTDPARESVASFHAGIVNTADLGAPLTQTHGTATWVGFFGVTGSNSKEFDLEITFGDTPDAAGKVEAFVEQSGNKYYHLVGTYGINGVIRGTVDFGTFNTGTRVQTTPRAPNGTLSGLIGSSDEEGKASAIGVFISHAKGSTGYAGGFFAEPNPGEVTSDDWTASFERLVPPPPVGNSPSPTIKENQFLQFRNFVTEAQNVFTNTTGPDTVLPVNLAPSGGFTVNRPLFFSGYFDDGKGNSDSRASERSYYAGFSNAIDLGAPLTAETATGEWRGRFQAIGQEVAVTEFELKVTFGDTPDAAGSVEAFVNQSGDNYYHLNGTYDSNGVITGDVDFGAFNTGTRDQTAPRAPNGSLTGLIGQVGAVGAFVSHATGDTGYAGGFVACPYDNTNNQCKQ